MKGQIIGIQRMSTHNGPGIRTTVFLKGCPLRCIWCHNPESQSCIPEIAYVKNKCTSCGRCIEVCPNNAHSMENGKHVYDRSKCIGCGQCTKVCLSKALIYYGEQLTIQQILDELKKDSDYYGESGGVTVSGGEPLVQIAFLTNLLSECKKKGYHTAVDTCGFAPRAYFERIIPYTDMFLYDLKHIDSAMHEKFTGQSNMTILDNLCYLDEQNCKIEIRIPLIPSVNTDEITIRKIGTFLCTLRSVEGIRILKYNPYCGSKYDYLGIKNIIPQEEPLSAVEMEHVANILREYGLKVIM